MQVCYVVPTIDITMSTLVRNPIPLVYKNHTGHELFIHRCISIDMGYVQHSLYRHVVYSASLV